MAKKKGVLDSLPENEAKDHRYRYLSNLGTFHLHRWIALPQEKRNADLTDLRESERLIALAIKGNPQAHFGREIYQLMAIRWFLWDGVSRTEAFGDTGLGFDSWNWVAAGSSHDAPAHISGISGLVQLGLAWESSDAFRSLGSLLSAERLASISELAYLRENELVMAGKGSLHPVAEVRDQMFPVPSLNLSLSKRKAVAGYFSIARVAAEQRNSAWINYQETRFAKGMHPDTHPDFWKSWTEPVFPAPPGPTLMDRLWRSDIFWLGVVVGAFGLFASFVIFGIKRATRIPNRPQTTVP